MAVAERWIIGRGLLGRAIGRHLGGQFFHAAIPWHDPQESLHAFASSAERFFSAGGDDFEVYWCAGKGVTSTSEAELSSELDVFVGFLDILAATTPRRARIRVFLASSVGGAYAGVTEWPPFSETTPPVPLSAYGRTKLSMEQVLTETAATHGWRVFVARITNLYGPGQDLTKGQGLISTVVRSYITGSPVRVFVSLDTLRDYIYEDDCAQVVLGAMERLAGERSGTTVLKIVGAMTALSVGAILAENSRLRRRRAPIVLGAGSAAGQAPDLRVRSVVWTDLDALVRTTFAEGLDRVYRAQLAQWAAQ